MRKAQRSQEGHFTAHKDQVKKVQDYPTNSVNKAVCIHEHQLNLIGSQVGPYFAHNYSWQLKFTWHHYYYNYGYYVFQNLKEAVITITNNVAVCVFYLNQKSQSLLVYLLPSWSVWVCVHNQEASVSVIQCLWRSVSAIFSVGTNETPLVRSRERMYVIGNYKC